MDIITNITEKKAFNLVNIILKSAAELNSKKLNSALRAILLAIEETEFFHKKIKTDAYLLSLLNPQDFSVIFLLVFLPLDASKTHVR